LNSGRDPSNKPLNKKPATKAAATQRDTGSALRTAYQETVREAIPDEMLDLLGKLS